MSSSSLSYDNHVAEFSAYTGITKEMDFNTKLSDYITGSATIVYPGHLDDPASPKSINDWTPDNYRFKSALSLNKFFLEIGEDNFTGGAGFKVFQEREGLVSALNDIEYQFFPVDATNPLRMKGISVPGLWGKYHFHHDTYLKVVGYNSQWSKISPDVVPDLKHMKLRNPTGDQGYGLFTTLGTKFDDTDFEVGFTRGWGSWPSKEREPETKFSPNPYRVSAVFIKAVKNFDSWKLGSTALVKDANEKAGSVYNMLFSVDKNLSLWGTPVSVGGSYFYVQSFEQSRHLRTSPWEDLGNSFSVRAAIEDQTRKIHYGLEGIINHEEKGFYFMGLTEMQISDPLKLGSQMNFFSDGEKYISNEYDWISVSGYVSYTF
jgi:hypothetical protein